MEPRIAHPQPVALRVLFRGQGWVSREGGSVKPIQEHKISNKMGLDDALNQRVPVDVHQASIGQTQLGNRGEGDE